MEALLGKFDLSNKNESGSESMLVSEIVIHPDWNYNDIKYDADLSIVLLERNTTFNVFIRPVCLPKQSDAYVTGTGTVVGWGKSETSGSTSSTMLSKLVVPAIDPSVCYTTVSELARYSSNRVFCGGYNNEGRAPCFGDSGGGFYLVDKERLWTINGIVSGSLTAEKYGCDINKYSLYTHVAKFANWIDEVIIATMSVDYKYVDFNCEGRQR